LELWLAAGLFAVPDPLGLRVMQQRLDEGAKEHRELSHADALERLRGDFTNLMEMCEAFAPEDWGGLMVPPGRGDVAVADGFLNSIFRI
jgi:hypothetical protein